jgi:uncharacterized protein Yka (UPF0111/DUF47 family)
MFHLVLKKENENINENIKKSIKESIKELDEKIDSISLKVNEFYYDNELVKHQIMLQEELKYYEDQVDSIKSVVLNAKKK